MCVTDLDLDLETEEIEEIEEIAEDQEAPGLRPAGSRPAADRRPGPRRRLGACRAAPRRQI